MANEQNNRVVGGKLLRGDIKGRRIFAKPIEQILEKGRPRTYTSKTGDEKTGQISRVFKYQGSGFPP